MFSLSGGNVCCPDGNITAVLVVKKDKASKTSIKILRKMMNSTSNLICKNVHASGKLTPKSNPSIFFFFLRNRSEQSIRLCIINKKV